MQEFSLYMQKVKSCFHDYNLLNSINTKEEYFRAILDTKRSLHILLQQLSDALNGDLSMDIISLLSHKS